MSDEGPITLLSLAREINLPAPWLKAEALAGRIPWLRVGRALLFNLAAVKRALLDRAAASVERPELVHAS